MFGVGYNGSGEVINALSQYAGKAGLLEFRSNAQIENIFPSQASVTNPSLQNWTHLDTFLQQSLQMHMRALIDMTYTPSWLQPTPNPCTTQGVPPAQVAPINMQQWGQLAALIVAHVDKTFPNLPVDYEIWNEPDGVKYLCTNPYSDQVHLLQYSEIVAAAAPLMKQQAQKDGIPVKIGIGALTKKGVVSWLSSLLHNNAITPYVNFVSYHDYILGSSTATWEQEYAATQDPSTGVASLFEQVAEVVRSGQQSNPLQTPIYLTEYNSNTGLPNSSRNSQQYAPVWNALFVADLFNTVLDTQSKFGAAQAVPEHLLYYTSSNTGNEFCMFGTIDTNMDCSLNGTVQPYPQYYIYQLLTDQTYLDLADGGYIANTFTSTTQGINATAFYTPTKDNLFIVNISATSYPALTVGIQNPGNLTSTSASIYTLNPSNSTIGTNQISLSQGINGYVATIPVPAYSTVALSFTVSNGQPASPTPTTVPSQTPTPTQEITTIITPTITPATNSVSFFLPFVHMA